MEKWEEFYNSVKGKNFNIQEFLTRSEGPELFTTALNDVLIRAAAPEVPNNWNTVYSTVNIDRRDIRFPSIRGVQPQLVGENAEFPFRALAFTSVTVTPQKFGMRLGFTNEMIQDNEVDLMSWRSAEAGRAERQLKNDEAFKAMVFFSTTPAGGAGAIGPIDKGPFYPTGGYTNVVSGTDTSWEFMLDRAVSVLQNQTLTAAGDLIRFPVVPDTLVINPHWSRAVRKVLNASITVVTTGLIAPGASVGTNLPGSNVLNGLLRNIVEHPVVPTAKAFVMAARRGLVMVEREPLQVDTQENWQFDASELRTKSRYLPAVIEERFIADLQFTA